MTEKNANEDPSGVSNREEELLEQGEEEDFPLHPAESVHEFPSQGGIRADYQLHEEHLEKFDIVHPRLGKSRSHQSLCYNL